MGSDKFRNAKIRAASEEGSERGILAFTASFLEVFAQALKQSIRIVEDI